ncbi:radical SAM/SPASM domain-containing protein [Aquiflexum sp. TKW24L]|uniref:radical SAM/SPASM domain-containing protein n=1 Tax=Aquiflexum sp. TKW24L TaxID=2942212 RepID=UPI0020BF85C6|nr:radical SAM/SPASM domain-containing protein [Aquiflexum sp. TKW24L]
MSFKKLSNYLLLFSSYHLSRISGNPKIWGYPTTLSVEPTTSCNLRCPECPSGLRSFTRPTGMIEKQLFQNIIDQSKDYLTYLHIYFQGEPFLHPKFMDMVSYADKNKVFTSTSTNAHYLNEKNVKSILDSGLKQLIVSMDGITQEIYEDYRIGGNLEKVKAGLELLIQKRKEAKLHFPRIVLQFLVTGKNEHQIPALKDWAKDIGVDELQLKTTQIYDFENGSPLIPKDHKYSRYLPKGDGTWKLKKEIENKCWRMWQGAVFTWDGNMLPCCFDKDGQHVMGKITLTNLKEIWNNEIYSLFRKQLMDDRSQIDICKNCTE